MTLNLLNSQAGLPASRLLELVPGYQSGKSESALRKLERDLVTLRSVGMDVETIPDTPPRYRIRAGQQQTPDLSSEELALLSRAAKAWGGVDAASIDVMLNKLRGVAQPSAELGSGPLVELEGGGLAPSLHRAIESATPISFRYVSKKGQEAREVAPWELIARGGALYLWGFDLNRWDARLFRLSRFRSDPEPIGEAGSAESAGPLSKRPFDPTSFLVSPLLAVRPDAAPLTRLRSSTTDQEPQEGWEIRQGDTDDTAAWESTILREASDVVVLEPQFLQRNLMERLKTAASWSEHG